MSASERLTELNIELPATPVSLGAYAPAKRVGTRVFTSGQLPIDLDGNIITGRLGADVDLDSGKQAARLAILRAQAAVVSVAGIVLGIIGGGLFLRWRNEIRRFVADVTGRDFFPQDIYFLSSIPSEVQAGDLASICGVAVLLCLLAAYLPAWVAARVDPAVALRD